MSDVQLAPTHIDLSPVESSHIAAIGYHPESQTMAVQFKSNDQYVYHYAGVSPDKYDEFKNALSIGQYFHMHVRGKHVSEKRSA
jgi:hypothetical protein